MKSEKNEAKYLVDLGKRITKLREAAGLSVQELADKVEVSRMHIYRIERGENAASIIVLRRIADALGFGLSDILNE